MVSLGRGLIARSMGLSEPRKKQRLIGAATQRNTAWLNDLSLPGQRMMSMMGWAPGTGLGTSNQGMSTNLTVSMKLDNKGIGAHRHEREALEQGKADAWVGAGGDLGSLFDRLNQANQDDLTSRSPEASTSTVLSPGAPVETQIEPRPAFSRLAHRAKFRKAKQLGDTSTHSMNEILGISSASKSAMRSLAPTPDSKDANARGLKHVERETRSPEGSTTNTKASEDGEGAASPQDGKSKSKTKNQESNDNSSSSSKKSKDTTSKKSKRKEDKSTRSRKSKKSPSGENKSKEDESRKRKEKESGSCEEGSKKSRSKEERAKKNKDKKRRASPKDNPDLPWDKDTNNVTMAHTSPSTPIQSIKRKRSRDSVDNKENDESNSDTESPRVIMHTSKQFVFQYLSNKLIRKKADIARLRREQGRWWGA